MVSQLFIASLLGGKNIFSRLRRYLMYKKSVGLLHGRVRSNTESAGEWVGCCIWDYSITTRGFWPMAFADTEAR